MVSRADYLDVAAQNAEAVLRMRAAGRSTREIADALRLSQRRVQQIVRDGREMSVPVYGGEALPSRHGKPHPSRHKILGKNAFRAKSRRTAGTARDATNRRASR